jgi:hypothetical protein
MVPAAKFPYFTDSVGQHFSEVELGLCHPQYSDLQQFSHVDYDNFSVTGEVARKAAIGGIGLAAGAGSASGASALASQNQSNRSYEEGVKLADLKVMSDAELASYARSRGFDSGQVSSGYRQAKAVQLATGQRRAKQGMQPSTVMFSNPQAQIAAQSQAQYMTFSEQQNRLLRTQAELANFSTVDYNHSLDDISSWQKDPNI